MAYKTLEERQIYWKMYISRPGNAERHRENSRLRFREKLADPAFREDRKKYFFKKTRTPSIYQIMKNLKLGNYGYEVKSEMSACARCSRRYIKTRGDDQLSCLFCINIEERSKNHGRN